MKMCHRLVAQMICKRECFPPHQVSWMMVQVPAESEIFSLIIEIIQLKDCLFQFLRHLISLIKHLYACTPWSIALLILSAFNEF